MAMLINNNKIKPYIKIGIERDFCIICAMKKGITPDRDIYETQRSLTGKLTNKPMVYLNQRGFEQCICMDCIREIAEKYTDLVAPKKEAKKEIEVEAEKKVEEEQKKEVETKKETKKNKSK